MPGAKIWLVDNRGRRITPATAGTKKKDLQEENKLLGILLNTGDCLGTLALDRPPARPNLHGNTLMGWEEMLAKLHPTQP
jgi:hypothetical protein